MLDLLKIEATPQTPEVVFNGQAGHLSIKGRSIPDNSTAFYKPLHEWIDTYCLNPNLDTVFEIYLEYLNTTSSKCLLNVLKKLESIRSQAKTISIHWYFEEGNEYMEEAGQDYEAVIQLPFKIIAVAKD
jgi:hypothetical protein